MNTSDAIKEFKNYTEIAYKILQNDTNYLRSKKIISDVFKVQEYNRFETVIFRLTVIDSYYSTQMNKRLFGLDDLANAISNITKDDESLVKLCIEFAQEPNAKNPLTELFNSTYGIRKTGHVAGQAASLISKYLYFLSNYKFPIYDNLAKVSYILLENRYPEFNLIPLSNGYDSSYFNNIRYLNIITNTYDYNKLDNFLWLIGKLTEGSLSLILNKERYLKLIQKIGIEKGTGSRETDEITREYFRNNINNLRELFNEDEINFIKYTNNLVSI